MMGMVTQDSNPHTWKTEEDLEFEVSVDSAVRLCLKRYNDHE